MQRQRFNARLLLLLLLRCRSNGRPLADARSGGRAATCAERGHGTAAARSYE